MSTSVVVCTSFRFYREVIELQRTLEKAGIRCEIPIPNKYLDPKTPWKLRENLIDAEPQVFEAAWRNIQTHLRRIESTDLVYVFAGEVGYVGNGVSSEMGYSRALRRYGPSQKPRYVLSSHTLADRGVRGYIDEVVNPDNLIARLQ